MDKLLGKRYNFNSILILEVIQDGKIKLYPLFYKHQEQKIFDIFTM